MEYVYVIVERMKSQLDAHQAVFATKEDAKTALRLNWPPEKGWKYNSDETICWLDEEPPEGDPRHGTHCRIKTHVVEIFKEKVRRL